MPMHLQEPRNFVCPEGGLCYDGRCKRDLCYAKQEARVAAAARLAEAERRSDPEVEKAVKECLLRYLEDLPPPSWGE
jgi:hypothetical protein